MQYAFHLSNRNPQADPIPPLQDKTMSCGILSVLNTITLAFKTSFNIFISQATLFAKNKSVHNCSYSTGIEI